MSKFISIEGLDGVGKTTIIRGLKKEFPDAVFVKEPGTTYTGKELRRILLNSPEKLEKQTELLLFVASFIETSQKVIIPALREKKLVIADRWYFSTRAYQEYAYDISPEDSYINKLIGMANVCHPDLNIILDIPFELAMSRIKSDDKIETRGTDYLRKVHEYYYDKCDGLIINAECSQSEVLKKVMEAIEIVML